MGVSWFGGYGDVVSEEVGLRLIQWLFSGPIVQATLAVVITSATCIQWVLQIPVSEAQLVVNTTIVTYYFANRRNYQIDDPVPDPVGG